MRLATRNSFTLTHSTHLVCRTCGNSSRRRKSHENCLSTAEITLLPDVTTNPSWIYVDVSTTTKNRQSATSQGFPCRPIGTVWKAPSSQFGVMFSELRKIPLQASNHLVFRRVGATLKLTTRAASASPSPKFASRQKITRTAADGIPPKRECPNFRWSFPGLQPSSASRRMASGRVSSASFCLAIPSSNVTSGPSRSRTSRCLYQ